MLKKIAIGIAAAIAIVVAVIATRPATFRVARTADISAPPEVVFPLVNDFHQWPQWSPWEKIDPAMKRELSGPDAGVGATYAWTGNDNVGQGRMTILESKPSDLIRIKLEFFKPLEATNQATFSFQPVAGGTRVTWTMDGTNGFVGKAIGLLMDMDSMIGKSFEEGLTAMKSVAETQSKKRTALTQDGASERPS